MSGETTEQAHRDNVELRWCPEAHLVEMGFSDSRSNTMATAEDAAWVIEQYERWFGSPAAQRCGILVDCARIDRGDTGWRAALADYHRAQPPGMFAIAWYNVRPVARVMVEMFAIAIPSIEGKVFGSEADARAWLRKRGIG